MPLSIGRRWWNTLFKKSPAPVLLVVEGAHDATFLKHVSRILSLHDPDLPNLGDWEADGRCLFLPVGGGDAAGWTDRLAFLRLAEFHLYDRELPPTSELRRARVERLNRHPRRRAFETCKRALENYLHPQAVGEALGIELTIHDDTAVAEMTARAIHDRDHPERPWDSLPYRSAKRRRERAKRLLNTQAVERMTAELLAKRDPQGEIAGWLETIAALAAIG